MNILELLEDLHLDKVNDRTVRKAAKGLAFELFIDPLDRILTPKTILNEQSKEHIREVLTNGLIEGLRKAVDGNMLTKVKIALSIKKNADRKTDLPDAEIVPISIDSLVNKAEVMHIHHMRDEDYSTLASEIVRILLDEGRTAELFTWNTVCTEDVLNTFRSDAVNKVYSGLETALGNQEMLMERAEESKKRAERNG